MKTLVCSGCYDYVTANLKHLFVFLDKFFINAFVILADRALFVCLSDCQLSFVKITAVGLLHELIFRESLSTQS